MSLETFMWSWRAWISFYSHWKSNSKAPMATSASAKILLQTTILNFIAWVFWSSPRWLALASALLNKSPTTTLTSVTMSRMSRETSLGRLCNWRDCWEVVSPPSSDPLALTFDVVPPKDWTFFLILFLPQFFLSPPCRLAVGSLANVTF